MPKSYVNDMSYKNNQNNNRLDLNSLLRMKLFFSYGFNIGTD